MHRGIGNRYAVRLSVRLSVKRMNCGKTYETSDQTHTLSKSMHLDFGHEKWLVVDDLST